MVRDTSIEAFKEITESGLIGIKQMQVYKILYEHGPMSGAQVALKMKEKHGKSSVSETVRNRLGELRDIGVAKEVEKAPCPITTRRVIIWDVTSGLPEAPQKMTRHEKRQEILRLMANVGKFVKMEKEYLDDYREAYRLVQKL